MRLPGVPEQKSTIDDRLCNNSPALHVQKAFRWQAVLRIMMVVALAADLAIFPPDGQHRMSVVLVVLYTSWTLALLCCALKAIEPSLQCLYPFCDLLFLTALMATSGDFSDPVWNSPVSGDAFLLIPVLASFQMRPALTAISGTLAAASYVAGTVIGHHSQPYWDFVLVHAMFILVVGAGCVLLSSVQRHRVRVIGELAEHRLWLLDRVMAAEEREQRKIAEVLHDGALQNVLAARHFVDEASWSSDGSHALSRADEALTTASRQLRCCVRTLHPEVLVSGGLVQALNQLTEQAAERGKFVGRVQISTSSTGAMDRPLYWLAREVLENVVKHAQAQNVSVQLSQYGSNSVKLAVCDDGVGISDERIARSLSNGHIGLVSHRARIESLGGVFTVQQNAMGGTTVEAVMPITG